MPIKIKVIQENGSDEMAVEKFENKISEYLQQGLGNYEIHYSTCTKNNTIMYSALIITKYDNFDSQTSFTTATGTTQFTFDQPSSTGRIQLHA